MTTSFIPDEVIAEVLRRHDIVEVVSKTVHLVKRGRNYIGLCPFHSEKTPSFNVNPEKQSYHCFGCGEGGSAIRFVMAVEGLTFPEAVRHMAEEADIAVSWSDQPREETQEQRDRRMIIEAHEHAVKLYHYILMNTTEGRHAIQYLRSRGFTDKWIDDFQIGYAPDQWDTLTQYLAKNKYDPVLMEAGGLILSRQTGEGYYDRFRKRIMFPIHDPSGKPIAFSGRALGDDQPKYMNSPETPVFVKSRSLFNLHRARPSIRKGNVIVLFEGHVDVVRAYENGTPNSVAAMGTALTEHHAGMIRRLANQVILCYDGDKAGQEAAAKSLVLLEQTGLEVRVGMMPDKMDPDDYIGQYGGEAFREQIIEVAVPSTRFKLQYLKNRFPVATDEGRLKYIGAALKVIASLEAPTEREFYMKDLSAQYSFSLEALTEQLHQMRLQLQKNKAGRDNNEISWNNVMQSESGLKGVPALPPAYHNAERKLLAVMLENKEVAQYVQDQLADRFAGEAHAAIAAYLYAYYEQGHDPDPGQFIAQLQDDKLVSIASALTFIDVRGSNDMKVIEDYVKEIKKYPIQIKIRNKKDELQQKIRSGDLELAKQIGKEITTLEKELRS